MKWLKVGPLKFYQAMEKKSSETVKFVFSPWMWIVLKSIQWFLL